MDREAVYDKAYEEARLRIGMETTAFQTKYLLDASFHAAVIVIVHLLVEAESSPRSISSREKFNIVSERIGSKVRLDNFDE